jgi:hypothetical protein
MRNIKGDLFQAVGKASAICITTNGFVKANNTCVMGRGCALEAKKKWPGIDLMLGRLIQKNGNIVQGLGKVSDTIIIAFPVKHNWFEDADLGLIRTSCKQLVSLADRKELTTIVIPRPGCGNGKLKYELVEPILKEELDDRFFIITY